MKSFALGLAFIMRFSEVGKWPILLLVVFEEGEKAKYLEETTWIKNQNKTNSVQPLPFLRSFFVLLFPASL